MAAEPADFQVDDSLTISDGEVVDSAPVATVERLRPYGAVRTGRARSRRADE